jgi:hypothetical protein
MPTPAGFADVLLVNLLQVLSTIVIRVTRIRNGRALTGAASPDSEEDH